MTKRTVVDCDRCGALEPPESHSFPIKVGHGMDAAGSVSDDTREVNLCGICSGILARQYLISLSRAQLVSLLTG